jgi:hypothetical protein
VAEFNACFDYVEQRLTKAGFAAGTSGLDRNSRSPAQSYYIPGTNRNFSDYAFFETYWTKTRELSLYALDPKIIHATQPKVAATADHQSLRRTRKTDHAQKLMVALQNKKSGRHEDQYLLAVELRKNGADDPEIEGVLRECLGSEPRMEKKIRDSIRSLKQWRSRGDGASR